MRSATGMSPGTKRTSRSVSSPFNRFSIVDHHQRPDVGALHHRDGIADALPLVDGVRIADDSVLGPLDRRDLRRPATRYRRRGSRDR